MDLGHFQSFSAAIPVRELLAALAARPCRTIVLHRSVPGYPPLFYRYEVDAGLLALLLGADPDAPLERAFGLHEHQATPGLRGPLGLASSGPRSAPGHPELAVGGAAGAPRSAAWVQSMYPHLAPSVVALADGDTLEVEVSLGTEPRGSIASALSVAIPAGLDRVDVIASVSDARGLTRPAGAAWSGVLTVARDATVSPASCTFRAQALGPGPYSLTVTFHSGAAVLGHATLDLAAQGEDPHFATSLSSAPIAVRPEARTSQRLQITGTASGYEVLMWNDLGQALPAETWALPAFFLDLAAQQLQASTDMRALRQAGAAIWVQIPAPVRAFLCAGAGSDVPLVITSEEPLLPFEAMVLADAPGRPLLGVDRPVLRWVPREPSPQRRDLEVHAAACIRPIYAPPNALPDAEEEEKDLGPRLPIVEHVRSRAELEHLADQTGVSLVHFAGHAQGGLTGGLRFDGGPPVTMLFFFDRKLFEQPPFMFINGCQAALAAGGNLAAYANIPRTLVVARAPGVLASVIEVQSAAAREAAQTFYDTLTKSPNVGEAVRAIRRRALATSVPAHAATFLSYLLYAPPDLTLRVHRPGAPPPP